MDNKKIEFISPKDIKKGEVFTFEDLFALDDNLKLFNHTIKSRVIEEVSKGMIEERNKLHISFDNEFKKKEEVLRQNIETEMKKNNDYIRLKIESESREKELNLMQEISSLKSLKNSLTEVNQSLKERLEENKDLKSQYEEMTEYKLNILRKEFSKEKENLIKEYEDKTKSATTIGENAEEDIRNKLINSFKDDRIIKPNHAIGEADVLHEIVLNGEKISSIYYEIKNRKSWSRANYENFVDKVRKNDHDFNIFISSALPKTSRESHLKLFAEDFLYDEINNVYLVTFENWLPIIFAMRNQAIKISQIKGRENIENDIKQKVYEFFQSPDFKNYFSRVLKNVAELEKIFKSIQSSTIKGMAETNKISLEIENLQNDIDTKLLLK